MRWLLVGLLLGFAGGWFASRLVGDRDRGPSVAIPPDVGAPSVAAGEPSLQGTPLASAVDEAAQRAPDVEASWRRVEEARRAGDADALWSAIETLGDAGTLDAQRRLVTLMRDPEVPIPHNMGRDFYQWLRDSPVERVAEAARARYALLLDTGFDPVRAAEGWFALIGAHEGEAALERAEAEGHAVNEDPWRELAFGLLEAARPQALDLARRIAQADPSDRDRVPYGLGGTEFRTLAFRAWVGRDPNAAMPTLAREIEDLLDGRDTTGRLSSGEALGLYAATLPAASFPDARALIRRVADADSGLSDAFTLMERLHARGMSLDGLEDVIERPTLLLERMAAHGGPADTLDAAQVLTARMQILGTSWAQSERALDAIEATLDWDDGYIDRETWRASLLQARAERRLGGPAARRRSDEESAGTR